MNNKYIFGTISFDNQNFSLGVDVNSFKMEKSGYGQTIANLTYVYKLQLDNLASFFLKRSKPRANFNDGEKSLIIANAAYKSLNSRKVVKIK